MAREKILIAVLGILFLVVMPVWAEEIHNVVREGDIAKVESLLAKKPEKISAKDKDGKTPLHYAAYFDHNDIAELLIAKGADVKAKDREGFTPLHWAAGEWEVAELLRRHGKMVAEGYSEPDEEKKQSEKEGALSRLLNLFKK